MITKMLSPDVFSAVKMVKNALVPDPEGELLSLPLTPSWSKGRGREGKRRGEERGKQKEVRERVRRGVSPSFSYSFRSYPPVCLPRSGWM